MYPHWDEVGAAQWVLRSALKVNFEGHCCLLNGHLACPQSMQRFLCEASCFVSPIIEQEHRISEALGSGPIIIDGNASRG